MSERRGTSVADTLASVISPLFNGTLPVNFRAWDGSTLSAADPKRRPW